MSTYDARVQKLRRRGDKTLAVLEIDGNFTPETDDNFCFVMVDEKRKTCKQNAAFHALCNDVAQQMGEPMYRTKAIFKEGAEIESWAKADRQQARHAIDIILEFCKEKDITLSHKTWQDLDTKQQLDVARHKGVCIICGKKADSHHIKPVGMGNDRRKTGLDSPRLPLCRVHHSEVHAIGAKSFEEKYHLIGLHKAAKQEDK